MRKLKKTMTFVLGVLVSASLLAGCSFGKKDKKEKEFDYDKYVTLAEYQNIVLKTSDIDAQVKEEVDNLLKNHATYEKVTKGKVEDGDTVNINYVGKVDGKEFEGGAFKKEDHPEGYDLTIGSNSFIEGFEEALIGKEIGGTYDIDVTFPKEYKNSPDLAGKPAVFTVTINSKQGKEQLPELNDAFVKENVADFDTAEAYQKDLRDGVIENLAWKKVYGESKIDGYPTSRVKEMKTRIKTGMEASLKQQNLTIKDYMENQNMDQEEFEKQLTDSAKQAAAESTLYQALAKKENISVSDEEYQEALKEVLETNNVKDEAEADELFKKYYGTTVKNMLMDDLLGQNVREYLRGNVKEE